MDPMYKGKYNVNDENDCIVFLNIDAGEYITFKADGKTYYISDDTAKETEEAYELLRDLYADIYGHDGCNEAD